VGVQGSVQCDLIATSTGSSMCTSSLISTMMTAMAMVSRIVLEMKAPGEGGGEGGGKGWGLGGCQMCLWCAPPHAGFEGRWWCWLRGVGATPVAVLNAKTVLMHGNVLSILQVVQDRIKPSARCSGRCHASALPVRLALLG
jgi:hypothetical protein